MIIDSIVVMKVKTHMRTHRDDIYLINVYIETGNTSLKCDVCSERFSPSKNL